MAETVIEQGDDSKVPIGGPASDVESQELEWTVDEEKRLVKKLDFLLLPLLILAFFSLQLDRGNIGNALTDFFFEEVGITQNQFNVGQQLLSVGIVLLEIPSNLILYRVGPSLWIGCQIVAWGLVATLQAFQKGKGVGAFMATRLILGLCESGFIPASFFTLTKWYTRDETSKRFSIFFCGNLTSAALSGILAYGILHMRGIAGLSGWQWLFLLEGIFTVLVGFVFLTFFPQSTTKPVSLAGFRYFTERESQILTKRVLQDDPTKVHAKAHVSWQEFKDCITNWKLLAHVVLTICGLAPSSTMTSYAPTLVTSFGFGRLESNAMVSIGNWICVLTLICWGFAADKLGRRGPMVTLALFIYWGFTLGNRLLIHSNDSNKRFAILVLAIGFAQPWHPVNGSWMSLNAPNSGERSITLAIMIMSANTAGIIGAQLFQSQDGPLYQTGWTVILSLVSLALATSVFANAQYFLLNRRRRNNGEKEIYRP